MIVHLYAAKYFLRPYTDSNYLSTINRTINGTKYIVYRPNHGLAHSLRQGFLARDIITLILRDENHPLKAWLQDKLSKDNKFAQKVAILSSFQRSGRRSEISSSENPELYAGYERSDRLNFIKSFSNLKGVKCEDIEEIIKWSYALIWDSEIIKKDVEGKNISMILKAAHMLDLRRITYFDKDRILSSVAEFLMVAPTSYIIIKLWNQSGKYLYVSGDRDMEGNRNEWSDRFFILQNDPATLYFRLRKCMLT